MFSSIKTFLFHFRQNSFLIVASGRDARSELELMYRPANAMEWHPVGPQSVYRTFEDILIVLLDLL